MATEAGEVQWHVSMLFKTQSGIKSAEERHCVKEAPCLIKVVIADVCKALIAVSGQANFKVSVIHQHGS